jgi:polar amino acid transport system substrate-binding protein
MKAIAGFLCGLLFPLLVHAADPVTLRFAYETEEVFPYYVGTGEVISNKPGVLPELVLQLGRRIPGLKIEMSRMPWKRCLAQLQSGEVDAIVGSFKPDRLANGVYPMKNNSPDPAMAIDVRSYYLYKPRGSTVQWDGQQFGELNGAVGAPLGYSIVDDLQKMGVKVEQTRSAAVDFQKLGLRRLAAVAALEKVGDYYVRLGRDGDFVKVTPALATKEYYLMFSRQFIQKHPDTASRIWRTLAEVRDSEIDAMIVKYLD